MRDDPMRVDLLGYLLNALDDAERERVEEVLRSDPDLQRRLEELQEQLLWLHEESAAEHVTPPPGLAERTCERVAACGAPGAVTPASGRLPQAMPGARLSPGRDGGGGGSCWSPADMVVAAGVFLAASMLFFPAIANSRFRSHVTACQRNLQQLGYALTGYAEQHQGLFPEIPIEGNRAVAGVYAPLLAEHQLLTQPQWVICPASSLTHERSTWRLPTLEQIDRARGRQLRNLWRDMGGSYGYNLGYVADGKYLTPRNAGRAHYALLSDAPSLHLPGHQSTNHGGRGQNVLYEDNRVQFLVCTFVGAPANTIFLNRDGFAEAGIDEDDSVIGDSTMPALAARR